MAVLVGVFVLAAGGSARAGGSCITNADCNQSTNFCLPGSCDLFGQCRYGHNDAVCRVPPYGDNLFCNGVDFCNETLNGGAGGCDINPVNCVPPTPQCSETLNACVECLNNSQCTTAPRLTCKSSNGTCVQCISDLDCNDGVFCNGQETCGGTGLCQAGTPISCSPGKFCSEVYQGLCVQCEQDGICDDGLYCNGVETCNQTTHMCTAGAAVACKSCSGGTTPGQPCLVNGDCGGGGTCSGSITYCDEENNRCVQCNTDSQCPKDFNYCTDAFCIFNSCVQVSNEVLKCGDGLYCDGQEVCHSGTFSACEACVLENQSNEIVCKTQKRCTGGIHPVCTADSGCTTAFVCSNAPETACSSGAQCPSGGTCSVASQCTPACCSPGTPIDCSDPIACTLDKCDEATDSCTHTRPAKTCNNTARTLCDTNADCPQGFICSGPTYCDDGSFCNGQETCGTIGCENLTPRVCTTSPQTACTSDADCLGDLCQIDCDALTTECTFGQCSESQDQCVATPIRADEQCNDNDPCTINTFCNSQGQCLPSTTVSDTYRCVRLEWRNVTPQPVSINDTITVDLYAVADNCGSQYRGACPSGNMELFAMNVLLDWNQVPIRLDPPGNPNPQNPCSSANACYQCQTCSGGTNPGAKCVARCDSGPRNGLTCFADTDCNHQCSGGPVDGGFCLTNAECRVCVGGTNDGNPCASVNDCPGTGASCPAGGTCVTNSATCSSTVMTCLGGSNSGGVCTVAADCPPDGLGNPGTCSTQFTCQGGGVCAAPPTPSVYNWSIATFLNDCPSDGINGPCPYTGFPGNDGNAVFTAFDQLSCDGGPGPAVCVPPEGLFVTQFRFKAIRGGQNQIAIGTCAGNFTKTSVNSAVAPPAGLTSSDVLKAIGLPADINVKCTTAVDCDDLNVCTTDTCVNQTCVRTSNTLPCDDGLFCTPNDVCSNQVCVGSGTRCTSPTPLCDETNDRCVQCLTAATCGDSNLCTQDICDASGLCQHPPVDCSDGLSCTADTCVQVAAQPGNPAHYECAHAPNNAACSTGLFCSAKICYATANPQQNPSGCDFDYRCGAGSGNPCPNPTSCNETTDTCGGCQPPAVAAKGSRYIGVTPDTTQGSTPVAIYVVGDCETPGVACFGQYLAPRCVSGANNGLPCLSGADCPSGSCDKGFVDSSPVYMTAAQWGTVFVHAGGIIPKVKYEVFAGCNFGGPPVFSAPSVVQTYRWGDTDGNTIVNFADISGVVNAFKNIYTTTQTYQSTNVAASPIAGGCGDPQTGCVGQGCLNFLDISMTVDGFKSKPYPCPAPCP